MDTSLQGQDRPQTNRSSHLIKAGVAALGIFFTLNVAHAISVYVINPSSDTLRYETSLQSHWKSFHDQQLIVDKAKETQARDKWNIVSTIVDLSNAKIRDLQNADKVDQEKVANLSQKALCLSKKANASEPLEWINKNLEDHLEQCESLNETAVFPQE